MRFYRAKLSGHFDNQHTFLLDNKTSHGKIGYEVYTLFNAEDLAAPILVDRGFLPMTGNRNTLPTIRSIEGHLTITGMLNLPPTYVTLGKITESAKPTWPMRVEYINLAELAKLTVTSTIFSPYILTLEPQSPVMMTPRNTRAMRYNGLPLPSPY